MRPFTWLAAVAVGTPLALAGWLWLSLLSPWTYDRPEHVAPVQEGPHHVFVYGTLTHAPVRWLTYGRTGDPEPAALEGYRRDDLDLQEAPQGRVEGLVLTVDKRELTRLDRYERLGIRYDRVRVTLADGRRVWAYRRRE